MTKEPLSHLDVEDRGSLLIARLDGGPLAQLGPGLASALTALVGRVESDPAINAVVLTGTHPGRFIGHADVRWSSDRSRGLHDGRRYTAAHGSDRAARRGEGAGPQLETGRFQSVDEVVVEALRLLQEREELFASCDELRAQIAEGVAAEERGELRDGREAIADVRRRIGERLRSEE